MRRAFAIGAACLAMAALTWGQGRQGHPIGTARIDGDLIVLTLNEGALGHANLFDLAGHTLRFTPESGGYRVENGPLEWDSEFGAELASPQAGLHGFEFPFSGRKWNSLSIGTNGSIVLGAATSGRGGGVSLARFDQLQQAARTLVNGTPSICVFLKLRMSGKKYWKEQTDRAVITWDLTEPYGNIQDFTWKPTVNRFQAVLHATGEIDMSYQQLTARDAIVGVYPAVSGGAETELATLTGESPASSDASLDIRRARVSLVDGIFVRVSLETRAPISAGNNAQFRVTFDPGTAKPPGKPASKPEDAIVWTVRAGGRGRGGNSRLFASGTGVQPAVKVDGNTISFEGIVPAGWTHAAQVSISAQALAAGNPPQAVSELAAKSVKLSGIRAPEVDLSSLTAKDGPFPAAFESFHYLSLPAPEDLTCSVLTALGDKFDFLAYYSDFRVDNQEAGTPSNGPRGGNVTGIGSPQRGVENFCSQGRFQWQFIQPVYAGANQMQERPPDDVTSPNSHDVTFYRSQLGERTPDGSFPRYNYAMSQIGHEMGHRWSAFVSAKVNGQTIQLGPTHWDRGLQAPVAFPYIRPFEASAMGGGVWQDNLDGTFTQLDDDYYVPATGWSYLDLYLMGLITPAEVPDFFILKNLSPAGRDANNRPIFKAERIKITIQDVIAAEGPRLPAVDKAQKKFNTGMVVVVEHGKTPSRELIERTRGIRAAWIDYWSVTTGRRAEMTANPR